MKHVIDSDFLSLLEARELRVGKAFQGFFGGNRKSRDNGSSPNFPIFGNTPPATICAASTGTSSDASKSCI